MTFLPDNYEVPASQGKYMKLEDGENTFRVLSSAIIGWEYWNRDNKPVRLKERPKDIPTDIRLDKNDKPTQIKHFWAFVVWNYKTEDVQVLEITQKTIQGSIKALVDNPKWGDPKTYDITITRRGEGFDTEYSVMPNPHSDIPQEAKDQYDKMTVNLQALYEGKDPFSGGSDDIEYPSEEEVPFNA